MEDRRSAFTTSKVYGVLRISRLFLVLCCFAEVRLVLAGQCISRAGLGFKKRHRNRQRIPNPETESDDERTCLYSNVVDEEKGMIKLTGLITSEHRMGEPKVPPGSILDFGLYSSDIGCSSLWSSSTVNGDVADVYANQNKLVISYRTEPWNNMGFDFRCMELMYAIQQLFDDLNPTTLDQEIPRWRILCPLNRIPWVMPADIRTKKMADLDLFSDLIPYWYDIEYPRKGYCLRKDITRYIDVERAKSRCLDIQIDRNRNDTEPPDEFEEDIKNHDYLDALVWVMKDDVQRSPITMSIHLRSQSHSSIRPYCSCSDASSSSTPSCSCSAGNIIGTLEAAIPASASDGPVQLQACISNNRGATVRLHTASVLRSLDLA